MQAGWVSGSGGGAVDMPEEGGRVSGHGTVTEITSLPALNVRWPSHVRVVNE